MPLWLVWIAFLRRVWRQAGTEVSVPCPLIQPSVPSFKVIVRSGRLTKNDLALGGHDPPSIHVFLVSLATQTRWRFPREVRVARRAADGKMSRVRSPSVPAPSDTQLGYSGTGPPAALLDYWTLRQDAPHILYHVLVVPASLAPHQHKQKWHLLQIVAAL